MRFKIVIQFDVPNMLPLTIDFDDEETRDRGFTLLSHHAGKVGNWTVSGTNSSATTINCERIVYIYKA